MSFGPRKRRAAVAIAVLLLVAVGVFVWSGATGLVVLLALTVLALTGALGWVWRDAQQQRGRVDRLESDVHSRLDVLEAASGRGLPGAVPSELSTDHASALVGAGLDLQAAAMWAKRARRSVAEGRTDDAVASYARALELAPSQSAWRFELAQVLVARGEERFVPVHGHAVALDAERRARAGRRRPEDAATLLAWGRLVADVPDEADLARRLFDASIGHPPQPSAAVPARRRLPGSTAPIAPEHVDRAARTAVAAPEDAEVRHVAAEPIVSGVGRDVEGVVRHRVEVAGTPVSLVQKTVLGDDSRELLLLRSGLLEAPRTCWRPPRLYDLAHEGVRWHLLMEDLGVIRALRTPDALVAAARGLGELNAAHVGDPTLADLAWLHDWEGLERVWALPDAAVVAALEDHQLPPELRTRLVELTTRLQETSDAIDTAEAALPLGLAHGDAGTGNVVLVDEVPVWFDWGQARAGRVGADLAQLLLGRLVAHPRRSDPTVLDRSLDAYAEQARVAGVDRDEVELGYRIGLAKRALRLKLEPLRRIGVPDSLELVGPDERAHRYALEDLRYLTGQVERLLHQVA